MQIFKKNEYLLKGGLRRPQAPGPTKENVYIYIYIYIYIIIIIIIKVDIRQTKMITGVQALAGGTDDEDGEWATAGVPGS